LGLARPIGSTNNISAPWLKASDLSIMELNSELVCLSNSVVSSSFSSSSSVSREHIHSDDDDIITADFNFEDRIADFLGPSEAALVSEIGGAGLMSRVMTLAGVPSLILNTRGPPSPKDGGAQMTLLFWNTFYKEVLPNGPKGEWGCRAQALRKAMLAVRSGGIAGWSGFMLFGVSELGEDASQVIS